MHMTVARCALAVAAVFAASTAAAQTVDEVIARHIEARGGAAKLKAIETVRITRTVATPFADLKVVVYRKRPHLLRIEQTVPGQATIARAVGGTEAWDTIQGKVVVRTSQGFADARDLDGDFDGPLVDWQAKGHTVVLEGREKLPGGEAYRLRVTTRGGASGYVYLDAGTYLDRRHVDLTSNRQAQVVVDFAGWREVNGVKFAFDITEERTGKAPVQTLVTYTESIETNVLIDDGMFAAPKGG